MKKIFYILSLLLFFAVSCENNNPENEGQVDTPSSLDYSSVTIAGKNAVVIKPVDSAPTAPVVVVVADDLQLATRLTVLPETPEVPVNFKAAEHCLIGGYILCIVEAESDGDASFLVDVKDAFPSAPKVYLLSYCNDFAYTAAMQIPETFNAYACVSATMNVETYKNNNFTKPVSFVHVHATENSVYKWNGVEGKSVSVPLSVGALVAINECITFKTTELLPREGKGRVSCTHYIDSLSGCDVKLYSVEGASNGWCDAEFEVYNQIWNFFKTH